MAQRRMFSMEIVDTDQFLDLPASSQCLYFHLGMRADDDGFISSPRKITNMVNCSNDDLKLLIAKGFVIPFDSGVCVIRDWKVNNYIQKDRYHESRYLVEKSMLSVNENQSYSLDTSCIQTVSKLDTEVRLELGESSKEIGERKQTAKPPRPRFIPPDVSEVAAYCQERKNGIDPATFVDYYQSRGWMAGRTKMKDWKAAVRTWERRDKPAQTEQSPAVPRTSYHTEIINGEEVDVPDA